METQFLSESENLSEAAYDAFNAAKMICFCDGLRPVTSLWPYD